MDVITENEDDEQCFKWATLAALYYIGKESSCKTKDLTLFEKVIDVSMMEFPVNVYWDTYSKHDLFKQFEEKNNISVNIFSSAIDDFTNYDQCVKEDEDNEDEDEDNDDEEKDSDIPST